MVPAPLRRALLAAAAGALAVAGPAVARTAPVAAVSGPAVVRVGHAVTFDANSSSHDPAGSIVEYAWDLDGSGTYAVLKSTPTLTTTFTTAGEVDVSLRVTDDAGATSVAVARIIVEGEPQPAPADPQTEPGPSGGDPASGVAPLDGGAEQWIAVGSATHFAAINGPARRRFGSVRRRGLWFNMLADRPARFRLGLLVPRAAARRLHLRGHRVGRLVRLRMATKRLPAAGQRRQVIRLPRRARRSLHAPVTLLVRGIAIDAQGNRARVARAFALRAAG